MPLEVLPVSGLPSIRSIFYSCQSFLTLKNSKIAVASKDLSDVKISNIEVENSKIGFAVFQKKPEYGYSYVDLTGLKLNSVDKPFLIEEGSTLVVEGEKIIANSSNVRKLLYGAELKTLN